MKKKVDKMQNMFVQKKLIALKKEKQFLSNFRTTPYK